MTSIYSNKDIDLEIRQQYYDYERSLGTSHHRYHKEKTNKDRRHSLLNIGCSTCQIERHYRIKRQQEEYLFRKHGIRPQPESDSE